MICSSTFSFFQAASGLSVETQGPIRHVMTYREQNNFDLKLFYLINLTLRFVHNEGLAQF